MESRRPAAQLRAAARRPQRGGRAGPAEGRCYGVKDTRAGGGGQFPVRGAWSFGGPDSRFGAGRAGQAAGGAVGPPRLDLEADPLRRLVETNESDNATSVALGIDGTRVRKVKSTACR